MNEPKAARYQRLVRRAKVARVASGAVLLALLAFSPLSAWLTSLVGGVGEASAFTTVLFVTAVGALWVGAAAAFAIAAIVVASTYLLGDLWWLGAGALTTMALAAALRLLPLVLPGMLNSAPITRASLMSGLREIARHSGVPIADIREWRAAGEARETALVVGLGRTRRVLVSSRILRDWSDDEIAVVVAHELAHHVHQDLWRALALNVAVLSAAFWTAGAALARWAAPLGFTGPSDPAALPFIATVAGAVWLVATPLRYAQSRAQERRADRFALTLTREAAAFGAAVRRLSERHLAEHQPSRMARWLFHRHPPVAERLAMAEQFAREGLRES
jgi:STE24 endopeptidase